ncbi:helix-turn-helix domain-containing protein [Saezia sanguinis]|uniref:helix-turn-helix domain-containing protein n=1 Tax=Saezia sanguinis TaxID=1965230 RepID=UPI000F8F012D
MDNTISMTLHSDAYTEMVFLLKKKIKALRWTQTKLAELTGMHQSYISRVESAR